MTRKGISKEFLTVLTVFLQDFSAESIALGYIINGASRNIKKQLTKKAAEKLEPIVKDFFTSGIKSSNKLFKKEITNLADDVLKIPFKYNKELLQTINKKSIFTGFYDKEYQSLFTKREIDAVKRKILTGKYSGWSDRQLASEIRNTINITKNRSLVMARIETQRLEGAAMQELYKQKKVKDEYVKVWNQNSEYERHKKYNGEVANEDGFFEKAGVYYPPPLESPYGCLCTISMKKRSEL